MAQKSQMTQTGNCSQIPSPAWELKQLQTLHAREKCQCNYNTEMKLVITLLNVWLCLLCLQVILKLASHRYIMYRIDHCVVGCMTRYLPWKIYLQRKPRKIIFPKVGDGSHRPLRSDLSLPKKSCQSIKNCRASYSLPEA